MGWWGHVGSETRHKVRSGPKPVSVKLGYLNSVLQTTGHRPRLVEQGGGSSGGWQGSCSHS